jgi:hypothetical protein
MMRIPDFFCEVLSQVLQIASSIKIHFWINRFQSGDSHKAKALCDNSREALREQ